MKNYEKKDGFLPFLSSADVPERKKERGPRRSGGGESLVVAAAA
jgi:hypothetical protein